MKTLVKKKKKKTILHRTHLINGRPYRGLIGGRVALNMPANAHCIGLIKKGIGIDKIAEETKMTRSQVIYRSKLAKVSVMEWRRGESEEAKVVLNKYKVKYY